MISLARLIHELQRSERTLEGLERRLARQELLKLHQNAQRLLLALAGTGQAHAAGDSIFIFDLKKSDKDQIDKSEISKDSDSENEAATPQPDAPDDEGSQKSQQRPS